MVGTVSTARSAGWGRRLLRHRLLQVIADRSTAGVDDLQAGAGREVVEAELEREVRAGAGWGQDVFLVDDLADGPGACRRRAAAGLAILLRHDPRRCAAEEMDE